MKITPLIASQEIPAVHTIRVPENAYTARAEGFRDLGRALGQSAEDWYQVARYEEAINKKARDLEKINWGIAQSNDLKMEIDNLHRESETRFRPDQHTEMLKWWGSQRRIIEGKYSADARSKGQDYYDLWQKESLPLWTNAEIKTRELRDKKRIDNLRAGWITNQETLVEDAAKAMSSGRGIDKMMLGYSNIQDQLLREGIITDQEAAKTNLSIQERIIFNYGKMEAVKNPLKAAEMYDQGAFQGLTPENDLRLQSFIDGQIRKTETAARQEEIATEKWRKDQQREFRNFLQGMIEEGRTDEALGLAQAYRDDQGVFDYDDVEWVRDRIKVAQEPKKTDDEQTRIEFSSRLYSVNNPLTQKEVDKALRSGLLTPQTAEHYSSGIKSLEKEADAKTKEAMSQAEQILKIELTTNSPFEKWNNAAGHAQGEALSQLWDAVKKDKLNPMVAVWPIIESHRKGLENLNLPDLATMRKRVYWAPQDAPLEVILRGLLAMEGKISQSEFDSLLQNCKNIDALETLIYRNKLETEKAKSGGKK